MPWVFKPTIKNQFRPVDSGNIYLFTLQNLPAIWDSFFVVVVGEWIALAQEKVSTLPTLTSEVSESVKFRFTFFAGIIIITNDGNYCETLERMPNYVNCQVTFEWWEHFFRIFDRVLSAASPHTAIGNISQANDPHIYEFLGALGATRSNFFSLLVINIRHLLLVASNVAFSTNEYVYFSAFCFSFGASSRLLVNINRDSHTRLLFMGASIVV